MPVISKKYQQMFQREKEPLLAQEVDVKGIPIPVKGWNAIDPLSNMQPDFAPILDNWVPRPSWIELRGGYNAWGQGLGVTPVETLIAYNALTTSANQLFAACGGSIFDVSTYGSVTLATSLSFTSNRFQTVAFQPAGGSKYQFLVNGVDPITTYDGTTWAQPSYTGMTSANIINIAAFKRRLWFIEKNSTTLYFLPTDAIQGEVTSFGVGSLLDKGSFIVAVGGWTLDGGNGPDDYFAIISNKGQVVLYKGIDPGNAAVWTVVGTFQLPAPLGPYRCLCSFGAELLYASIEGLIPISKALPFAEGAQRSSALTYSIQNAMLEAAQIGRTNFGWQVVVFPAQSLLIFNVPITTNSQQVQFVMNTITGAWTRFTGWNANCFEIYNESLYFGDNDGNVNLAYAGPTDLVSSINFDMQCAFNYFEAAGRVKNITMVRPFLRADGVLTPTMSIDSDFSSDAPAASVIVIQPMGGVWDEAIWDTDTWSSGSSTFALWQSVKALGTALALRMQVNLGGSGTNSGYVAISQSVFDTGTFDVMVFDGNGQTTGSGDGIPTLQVNAFQAVVQYGSPI